VTTGGSARRLWDHGAMQSLASLLSARVEAAAGIDPEMRPATKPQFGHFQSNVALRLAKPQGRPPREVAADLVARIDLADLCEPLEIAGPGFINLRIRPDVLAQAASALLADPHTGIDQSEHPQRSSSTTQLAERGQADACRASPHDDHRRLLQPGAERHRATPSSRRTTSATGARQFGMLIEQALRRGARRERARPGGSRGALQAGERATSSDEEFADRHASGWSRCRPATRRRWPSGAV
jgi:arginyl-tRNA synthetase